MACERLFREALALFRSKEADETTCLDMLESLQTCDLSCECIREAKALCLVTCAAVWGRKGISHICLMCADEAVACAPLWAVSHSRRGAALLNMRLHSQALQCFRIAQAAMECSQNTSDPHIRTLRQSCSTRRNFLNVPPRERAVIEKCIDICEIHSFASTNERPTSPNTDYQEPDLGRYPSTPHLPFSPEAGVSSDDTLAHSAEVYCRQEVVVTEKLDGGNCCLKAGTVYARTHSHEATHPSFSLVKSIYSQVRREHMHLFRLLDELGSSVFCENLFGVHSIAYPPLHTPLYVFAIHGCTPTQIIEELSLDLDSQRLLRLLGLDSDSQEIRTPLETGAACWYSWDDVVGLSALLGLRTTPVLYRGVYSSEDDLRHHMDALIQQSSSVGESVERCEREGFVVRHVGAFSTHTFADHVAKYVRQGHVQTNADWTRTWQKARFTDTGRQSLATQLSQWTCALNMCSHSQQAIEDCTDADHSANVRECSTDPMYHFLIWPSVRVSVRNTLLQLAYRKSTSACKSSTEQLEASQEKKDEPISRIPRMESQIPLRKFPRTPHLCTLGSETSDDITLDPTDQLAFLHVPVIIQEKVDGANIGLSLTHEYEVVAQNRSHYVTSETSVQFQGLGSWIASHKVDLCACLRPTVDILYGEWLAYTHTCNYTRLPSYFLAFDIYDCERGAFLAQAEVQRRLQDTSIHSIPYERLESLNSIESACALLTRQSHYGDEMVEGLVFRVERDGILETRSKIVRGDFFDSINEGRHWSKKILRKNRLA